MLLCWNISKWCYYKLNHLKNSNLWRVTQSVKALQMNWKVPGFHRTRYSTRFKHPTWLWSPRQSSGQTLKKRSDQHWVSHTVPSIMVQNWPWGGQRVDKKWLDFFESLLFFIACICDYFIFHLKKPLKIMKNAYYFTKMLFCFFTDFNFRNFVLCFIKLYGFRRNF